VSSSRQLSNYRARIHRLHMSYFIIFIAFFFYIIFFSISSFSILFFLSHLFLIFFFSQKVYREMKNIESLDSSLSPIVEAMKEKFLKYWEKILTVIIIANCLHPPFKKKIHRKASSKVQIKSTSNH
jgi:O-antigen ligase